MKLERISMPANSAPRRGDVLFIHGVYHAAWAWENFLPYFAERGYAATAMSLRGHGESEGREIVHRARFSDYLADVRQVLDQFDSPPIVIGHSLGGMLTQKLMETRALPAAVLMSTPAPAALRRAGFTLARLYPSNLARFLLTGNPDHIYKDRAVVKKLFFSPNRPEADLQRDLDRVLAEAESRRIMWDVSLLRIRKPAFPTPVLIVGGGSDYTLGAKNFEPAARLYGTRPVLFDGKSHDLMLEPGWEEVADHILDWLDNQDGAHRAP